MIRICLSAKLGELRWTQADLSRCTGIRAATIHQYYHELVDNIKVEHLNLICEALRCQPSEILIYVPDEESHCKYRTGLDKK